MTDQETFSSRIELIREELEELEHAYGEHDLVRIADALADLDYVVTGTAVAFHLPHDRVVEAVHEANMKKVRADGPGDPRSHRRFAGDVVKPTGWQPPDVAAVLRGAGWGG